MRKIITPIPDFETDTITMKGCFFVKWIDDDDYAELDEPIKLSFPLVLVEDNKVFVFWNQSEIDKH